MPSRTGVLAVAGLLLIDVAAGLSGGLRARETAVGDESESTAQQAAVHTPEQFNSKPSLDMKQFSGRRFPDGKESWKLFDAGAPGERPGRFGAETLQDGDAKYICNGPGSTDPVLYNVTEPELVPFLVDPEKPGWKNSTVLVFPGGSKVGKFLAWDKEGRNVAMWLNSMGISAVVLKYRVPDRTWLKRGEAMLADAQRAVSLVRSRTSVLGLDPKHLGVIGFGIGAELAARLSGTEKRGYEAIDEADNFNFRPNFQMLLYGAATRHLNEQGLSVRSPPTFMAHAQDDPCTSPQSIGLYFRAVNKTSVNSEIHSYPTGKSGFGACSKKYVGTENVPEACKWIKEAKLWVQDRVAGAPISALTEREDRVQQRRFFEKYKRSRAERQSRVE